MEDIVGDGPAELGTFPFGAVSGPGPQRSRRLPWLVGSGAALTFVAGVTSAIVLASTGGTSFASLSPTSAIAGVGPALAKKSTVEWRVVSHTEIDGQDITSTGTFAYDLRHRAAEINVAVHGIEFEERLVGDTLYVKLPAGAANLGGKPWVSLQISSLLSAQGLSEFNAQSADPQAALNGLSKLQGVQDLGKTTIDGVTVRHFRGTLDPSSMLDELNSSVAGSPALSSISGSTATEDVYVSADGLARRTTATLGITLGGESFSTSAQTDYVSFDRPLTVVAPPADQVRAVTSADNVFTS